jgi:hypothetical protein
MNSIGDANHGDQPARRFMITFGHYGSRIATPTYVFGVTIAIATMWLQATTTWVGPLRVTVVTFNFIVQATALAAAALMFTVHDRNLCLLDIKDAPLLDPQTAVTQNMRRLRLIHNTRLLTATGAAGALVFLFTHIVGASTTSPLLLTAATALAIPLGGIGVYELISANVHRRLKPWCPFCHGRGGFDPDPVTTPTPDPAGVANR